MISRSFSRRLVLGAGLVSFSCSLLTLFSAPTAWLWILAILVTEWGHYVALLALLFAAIGWRWSRVGSVFALAAAILSLSPMMRAIAIAHTLPARCATAFGKTTNPAGRAVPFSALDLFRGLPTDGVEKSEHVYATEDAKQLKLDLYRAKERGALQPLVIVVHGGSWSSGNKRQLTALNRYLAREGYAVASINYRHAPKFPFPAAVDDLFHALDFLKTNALRFGLDPTRIVLLGRSAGGQIALSAAYSRREPAIRGVIAFYAPSDLVLGYEIPSRRWVLDSRKVLQNYLDGAPNERPETYAAASPINFVNAQTPPTLLIHGQLDPIVWPMQSDRLSARLREAGREHLYLALPWATHGCDANLGGPSGQLSTYTIDRFLAAVFSPQ